MVQAIRIEMCGRKKNLAVSGNLVNERSIRNSFLLPPNAVVNVSYEVKGMQIYCETTKEKEFILPEDFSNMQFSVESDKAPSRPATPADVEGITNPKKRKIDPEFQEIPVDRDLADSIGRYALYYNVKMDNYKRSAIPLTPRLAATFRHGYNKSIEIGHEIVIRSWSNKQLKVSTRAVKIIEELDTIILKSEEADLCDKDLISNSILPRKGMRYLLMGFSILHEQTSHQAFSTGIIVSDVTRRLRYTGSSDSFKGDSGGSCWNEKGQLIGMQIEVEKVQHTSDDKGRPASPASGGRCCLVAMVSILGHILDLLPPPVSNDDWSE